MTPSHIDPHATSIDSAVLDRLLRADDALTLEHLGESLGLTATAVRAALDALAGAGCQIEIGPRDVRLVQTGLSVWSDYVQWATGPDRIVDVYRQTGSTQDLVRRIVEDRTAAADGALVVADHQTAGRGRLGRRWLAPPGTAVTFSLAWMGPGTEARSRLDHLLFATSVAVAEAIEALCGPQRPAVQIRWPNDVLLNGRKAAGILVETFTPARRPETTAAVIGVGINVSLRKDQIPDELRAEGRGMSSLAMCGSAPDRLRVLAEVVARIDRGLEEPDTAALLARWRQRSVLLSQRVSLRHNGRVVHVRVVDLDPHEGLIVQTDEGVIVHVPGQTASIV